MVPTWIKRLVALFEPRRPRVRVLPFSPDWLPFLEPLPFYATLDEDERERLCQIASVIIHNKHWEGCGGLSITDEIRVTIAAQAALLLLNLDHQYYRDVTTILVYPSAFLVDHDGDGHKEVLLGEAWDSGQVILAWDSASHGVANRRDGINVVLHEFAHKLDTLDDLADGTPPLADQGVYARWRQVMTREYEKLIEDDEDGRATLLDPYGASNPAEFFAVATECFFEKARQMQRKHPALYQLLRDYYRQDPAARG